MTLLSDGFTVNLKAREVRSYKIYTGQGLLDTIITWIGKSYFGKQMVLITDTTVAKLYARKLLESLQDIGFQVLMLEVKPGERSKTAKVKEQLELTMLENRINRYALCIAFGGGVVGDLAGFISATYMRGIKYIQIPTTMLSMVDSSVGGKTAINTKFGKNSIGAFYQPQAVFIDFDLLNTLPKKHLINGLVEAIKTFLIRNYRVFENVEEDLTDILALEENSLNYVVQLSLDIKSSIVAADEEEKNLRMILNFGHTIGHAIEQVTQYKMLHGYAVALGIMVEAQISVLLGKLSADSFERILSLFSRLKITPKLLHNLDIRQIADVAMGDKKNNNIAGISCVILDKIGSVALDGDSVVSTISYSTILEALRIIQVRIG